MKKVYIYMTGFLLITGMLFTAVPPKAHAQDATIQSLTALVAQLQAQLATLLAQQNQQGSQPSSGFIFTRDLTVGSSGADVSALQDFLIARNLLQIPVGVSKGYFGELTRSALSAFQISQGISPSSGYFGPITRARVNSLNVAVVVPPTTPTTPGTSTPSPSNNTEGDISGFRVLGNPSNEEVVEGEEVMVFGFELTAEDSHLILERADFQFEATNQNNSDRPWEFINSVALYLGDDEIATKNVGTKSAWSEKSNDRYHVRLSGIDARIEKDEEAEFYLSVTAKNNLDSGDLPQDFLVSIVDNGLRFVDGLGLQNYAGDVDDTVSLTFENPDSGDLKLKKINNNLKDRIVIVDESNTTTNETALFFRLEAKNTDIFVEDIGVRIATTTDTAGSIRDIVKSVHLYRGNSKLKTESVSSSATGTTFVNFKDIDLDIDEDDEETFSIRLDILKLSGSNSFAEGDGILVSVRGEDIKAEDEEGDDVNVSSVVDSGEMIFFTKGISVALNGTPTITLDAAQIAGNADKVLAVIPFTVTNIGDEDLYIDGDIASGVAYPTLSTDGIAWATTTTSNTGTSTDYSAVFAPNNTKSDDIITLNHRSYIVEEGESRNFTLSVSIPTGIDGGILGVKITGIKWDTNNDDDHAYLYEFNLQSFVTPLLLGLDIL